MANLKPVVVKADLMWAYLDTPSKKSKKYQVDLCNLSDQAVTALKNSGVKVRNDKPEKGAFITVKSTKYPIKAELEDGTPVECKVKNGSKGIATVKPYAWNWEGSSGVGTGVGKLVITDLKEYVEGGEVSMDDPL
jgi:hypothetical protein